MSARASRPCEPGQPLAKFVTRAGVVGVVGGGLAWFVVRSQMADEKIVIPGSAGRLAGRSVAGPVTAFREANAIKRIARDATGGKTYGQLPEGDPAAETALHASLLRASLFTSILAFGVAAMLMALGVVLMAIGAAMNRLFDRLPGQGDRPAAQ